MLNLAESVLEAAGIGGWELDVATGEVVWTERTFRILDLDPSEPPPPTGAIDFCAPEARAIIDHAMTQAVRCGAPWDLELPFITARGRDIWVRTRGQAIRTDGATTKLFGAFEDVTARHALAGREARLAMVARHLANGVVILDPRGRTEWVNAAFTRATGYTIEDLRGRFPGESLDGPDTDPATVRHITDCVRGGLGFEAEILAYAKEGRTVWLSVVGSPVHDTAGVLTGFVSVATDVTARRDAERLARHEAAERERAETLLRDVLDTLPSAVTAYDRDDRFILCNSLYAEMFPISARFAIPGRTHAEVVRLAAEHGQYADAPTDPAELDAWVQAQMEFQFSTSGAPRTLRLGDGRVMQVRERRSSTGTLVAVRTDTTDLHAAEARARHQAAERERAEALLRDVLDTVPTAIAAYDADERLILCNRAYAELFPVAASFVGPGRRYEDVVRHAVQRGQYAAAGTTPEEQEAWIAAQMAHHRSAGGERTLRVADGRVILARDRRSDSGNLVCVRTDVTELTRTEALLRDVLDALPGAVTVYDKDERLILRNRAYSELLPIAGRHAVLGRSLEEVVRLTAANGQFAEAERTPAEFEAFVAAYLALHRSPGPPRTVPLAEGRFVEARERRSESGNLVCVRSDITELMQTQALLRDVLDTLPSGVIAYDRDERYILSNRAHAEMVPVVARFLAPGRRLEDIVRLSLENGQVVDAPSTPAEREAWIVAQLAALRDPDAAAHTLRTAKGAWIQVRTRLSQTGNRVIVLTDTTDLKPKFDSWTPVRTGAN